MKFSKIIACAAVSAVAAASLAAVSNAYTGYIGVQDTVYSFRNAWDDGSYGKNAGNGAFDHMTMNGAGAEEGTYPDYEDNYDYDIGSYLIGSFTDVDIPGEGTYTVSVNDFDWTLDGANSFNLLFVSTDLPLSEGWVCTSASIIVDGSVTQTYENPDNASETYLQPCFANIWNPDLTNPYAGAYPTESLAIEFTVAKGEAPAAEETATEETTTEETTTEETTTEEVVTTGDVDAAVTSSKGSPDTGIADVAAVAGLAVVAAGAVVVAKKRK